MRIWNAVCRIPRGRVSTYGRIAGLAGIPGKPRLVGYALHRLPLGTDVPWHRVVNARGQVSFPPQSASWRMQRRLLEAEGILFLADHIDLGKQGWPPLR